MKIPKLRLNFYWIVFFYVIIKTLREKEGEILKEKKLVRIGFKKKILIILLVLAIIFGVLFIIYHFKTTPFSNTTTTTATTSSGLTSKTTIYSDTRKSIPEYSTEKYSLYSASIIQNSHFSLANQFVNLDNILTNW